MNRLPAFCLVLAAILPQAAAATDPDFGPLADLVRQTKDATALPSGTAIAVVRDGRIVWEGYFGFADIEARTPVTRDTGFYIASATKPFFALNMLLKEEAGLLDTRTSLQRMFPEVRFAAGIDADAVTARDLLVHTSGVDNPPLVWATAFSGIHDARSRLALVAASRADGKAARGTFKYTNVGYNIASVWLDRRLATPWQEQLDDAIFRPLSMHRTTAYVSKAEAAGWPLAKPYSLVDAQPDEPLYLAKSDETLHAAGGLVSTAPDLARFLMAQLAGGARSISRTAIERSQQPQVALAAQYLDFPRTGYAWGWYMGEYKGRKLLHHFGSFPGFHAHLSFMPEEHIALVVLNNEDTLSARLTSLIADYAYGVLLEEPGTASKASRRFDELQAQARKLRLAAIRHREAIQSRAWRLSRPREDYVGTYANDLLGDMTVQLDGDRNLLIRWGRLAATATAGERQDQVRVEFSPNTGEFLDFAAGNAGIEAISFDEMTFRRVGHRP
ncbi:MAG: serine hydrolase [Pseudoxanthomonas sp.]